jgi:hypothetical protein
MKTPKKPIAPFIRFVQAESQKGQKLAGKAAGDHWKKLSKEEKKPYIEEYKKERVVYDAYLEEEGLPVKKSSVKKQKTCYEEAKIRALLRGDEDIKEVKQSQIKLLGTLAVLFSSIFTRKSFAKTWAWPSTTS